MLLAGGLGGQAHPEFGVSANLIPTRGTDYSHRITACPPGFENLTTSLYFILEKFGRMKLSHLNVKSEMVFREIKVF